MALLQGPAESDYATYSRLNRGVSAIAVLVWPLAVFSWQRGLRWLALALPPAVLGLTLGSQSSASMVALGAGLLAAAPAGLALSLGRDRKSAVQGTRVSGRVDTGRRRTIKK